MLPPVMVSNAVDTPALSTLNPLGWHPLIAFSSPQVTFMDVNLHLDLNNNQPPPQVKAAVLKRSITGRHQH